MRAKGSYDGRVDIPGLYPPRVRGVVTPWRRPRIYTKHRINLEQRRWMNRRALSSWSTGKIGAIGLCEVLPPPAPRSGQPPRRRAKRVFAVSPRSGDGVCARAATWAPVCAYPRWDAAFLSAGRRNCKRVTSQISPRFAVRPPNNHASPILWQRIARDKGCTPAQLALPGCWRKEIAHALRGGAVPAQASACVLGPGACGFIDRVE